MARDTTDLTPLSSVDELVAYIRSGEKPASEFRVGTEHEKIGYHPGTLSPVAYEGNNGIRRLLEELGAATSWEAITDDGRIIGLAEPKGRGAISLEPGGQFELSGAAVATIHETAAETAAHFAEVKRIGERLGIRFLAIGSSPLWSLAETPVMPKSRYDIMKRYMPDVGTRGLDMMFRTTTIQANLDFDSERDMRRKMQVGMRLQAVASALFANSPFTDGKPNGELSWRSGVWLDVDNKRSGLLNFTFNEDFGYRDYVEWALDVPMYFVMRDGRYTTATDVTFRQFMDGAMRGRISDPEPTLGDWTNHLSTLFPDVRLKRFLEMRGADGGSIAHISALPAFWVGLLYDEGALADAEAMTQDWTFAEVSELRDRVPAGGLAAPFRNGTARDLAREALAIAESGLKSRARVDANGADESVYLQPLIETVHRGTTEAEELLADYKGPLNRDMERLFDRLTY